MIFTTLAIDLTGIYRIVAIVGYSLAALCLIMCIAIFFLKDIKGVYSFLSGRKKQQGINAMREQQGQQVAAQKKKRGFAPPPQKAESKRVAPPVVQAPPKPAAPVSDADMGTDVLQPAAQYHDADEGTDVLQPVSQYHDADEGTEVLQPAPIHAAVVPPQPAVEWTGGETAPLQAAQREPAMAAATVSAAGEETSLLSDNAPAYAPAQESKAAVQTGKFILVKNEMVIHTSEVL